MLNKYYKYAELLLKKGLAIRKKQPLVIYAPIESIDFIRVLTKVATNMKITDIYYDWYDDELKHSILKNIPIKDIPKNKFWNKLIHDEYAKKDAAFLFLTAAYPDIMSDISPNKIKIASECSLKTRKTYCKMQSNNKVSWCIAAVSTKEWGKMLFPDSKNPREDLWNLIYDICYINEKDLLLTWTNKMKDNKHICDKLTRLNIKTMHYENSLGTDLYIGLNKEALWCGGSSIINGKELLVNIPTEEAFTTPNKYKTNGIVYTSLPLVHNGIMIKDIMLEFKEGRVVNYYAKSGLSELKNILELDKESAMLGEAALVDKNSKIHLSGKLFYETLFDENASCHIALGRGFKECLSGGCLLSNNALADVGYNNSKNHVDIMIGTDDLKITAITYDNKEIIIFKDGSFNI